jgi:hypothetical protein
MRLTPLIFLLLIILSSACQTNPSQQPTRCVPFEVFIGTPEGGNLVSGVTVSRNGDGFIFTKWKTTLPVGTKSMIGLGQYRPNPKKDIPYGPSLDGTGMEGSACDGQIFYQLKPFGAKGGGYNQGEYYTDLTVIDNPIWKQPIGVRAILSSASGKVKAVSVNDMGIDFDVTARFQLPECSALAATTPVPPPTPISKEETEGIARKLLVEQMERRIAESGHPVSLSLSGPNNTIITVSSESFDAYSVRLYANDKGFMGSFRKLRLKKIIFTNGVDQWTYDL